MRFITTLFLIAIHQLVVSQDLYNNVILSVKGNASLFVSNSFTNASSANYLNDATVRINGNITNNQTTAMVTTSNTGRTILSGTAAQQLLGTQNFVTDTLNINNTSAVASNLVLNGSNSFIVKNDLVFVDGIVATNANNITLNNLATYKNANDTRHINGFVRKIGNQAFTFPVGDGSRLRTASISAPSPATDAFTGKYFQSTAPQDLTQKDAVLDVLSNCENWTIDRTSGATNIDVTLSWLNTGVYACLGAAVPLIDYYIGGWNGSTWKSFANATPTGTTATGTVTSVTKPTVYGAFTLAKRNIPLPITLVLYNATMSKEGVNVSWVTTNHSNSNYFIVERSGDGIVWELVRKVPSENESNTTQNYSITDQDYKTGTNYYRLTEVSTKGDKTDYGVRVIEVNHLENIEWSISPNPNNGEFIVQIKDNDQIMSYDISCIDILGKELFRKKLTSGSNQVSLSSLSAGTYIAKIKLNNHFETKKIVLY